MPDPLSRRRFLSVFAATAAFGAPVRARGETTDYEWTGTAMGSDARILFCGGSPARLRATAARAAAEIERLEEVLSLFRETSEISRLNRDGRLADASLDLRQALYVALAVARASGGLFDPTVQALWEAHADWFASNRDRPPPPERVIARARRAVDWRRIEVTSDAIRLADGQRITLNGLGQGYVTDRIADLLRAEGFAHVLIDLGEQRALGSRRDGSPWRIAREGASAIDLAHGALATSEGRGCAFDASGSAHHLFDPRTGRSAATWTRLTAHHASAAVADALSTALYAAKDFEIDSVLARFPGARVWATDRAGRESVRRA